MKSTRPERTSSGGWPTFKTPAVSFESKKNAVLYINSNCWNLQGMGEKDSQTAYAGRSQQQQQHQGAQLWKMRPQHESAGNGGAEHPGGKIWPFCRKWPLSTALQILRADDLENSNEYDYVTEKVLPGPVSRLHSSLLMEPPTFDEYVPSPSSIIDYSKFGSTGCFAG